MKNSFDAEGILLGIRESRSVRRRRATWGKSKLNKFLSELIQLRAASASYADIQYWLRKEKRMKVDRSTIKRFIDKSCSISMEKD